MNSNIFGRRATLLTVAIFMAIFSTAFAQTPITQVRAKQLLAEGDAGVLRNHLISKLGATPGKIGDAEKRILTVNGKKVNLQFVSQLVSYKRELVDQITIKITENGITKSLDFVQYANGDIGKLEGTELVTYSGVGTGGNCLDQLTAACSPCRAKIASCLGVSRAYKIYLCLLSKIDGSCLNCGVTAYAILACILLDRIN